MKKSNTVVLALFFGAFLLAGISIGYVTVKDLRMAMESESWPTVDGVVTKSRPRSGGRLGRGWPPLFGVSLVEMVPGLLLDTVCPPTK